VRLLMRQSEELLPRTPLEHRGAQPALRSGLPGCFARKLARSGYYTIELWWRARPEARAIR